MRKHQKWTKAEGIKMLDEKIASAKAELLSNITVSDDKLDEMYKIYKVHGHAKANHDLDINEYDYYCDLLKYNIFSTLLFDKDIWLTEEEKETIDKLLEYFKFRCIQKMLEKSCIRNDDSDEIYLIVRNINEEDSQVDFYTAVEYYIAEMDTDETLLYRIVIQNAGQGKFVIRHNDVTNALLTEFGFTPNQIDD